MITYKAELLEECIEEATPFLVAHYEEIANNKEVKQLAPDWEQYIRMEKAGILRIYTARDDGKLIGYFVSMCTPHLHYKHLRCALNDILYLAPEYRGGTIAYRMFKGAMKDLKENMNIQHVMFHMKIKHPFSRLLTKLGAEQTEETWEVTL